MSELDVFLMTYNCGKKGVDGDGFTSRVSKALPKKPASLFVFGFEEFCSILDGSFPDQSNRHMIALNKIVLKTLADSYSNELRFSTLGIIHTGAIGIIVITPYALKFSNVRTAATGCGYLFSSLKGAVGIRVNYKPIVGSSESVDLTFANAHLSAYEGQYYYNKRNAQVLKVMRALDFHDDYGFLKPESHAFFMGDLNYRTVKNKGETIPELVALQDQSLTINPKDSIESLVQKYDELSEGIRNDEVFMGFTEGCITWQPTYKYHVGTAIYNTKRSPSWCDRILFQSTYNHTPKLNAAALPKVNDYKSIETLLTSDHHPVYLNITVPFQAPVSIISSSGYLKILPNDQVIDHFHRNNASIFEDTVSGPTQFYVLPTRVDQLINSLITPLSDRVIGYTLWLTTTPGGRLLVLASLLILGGILFFL